MQEQNNSNQMITKNQDSNLNVYLKTALSVIKDKEKAKQIVFSLMSVIDSNKDLKSSNPQVLKKCFFDSLSLGLTIDKNNYCWLVPYKGNVVLQIGKNGYLKRIKDKDPTAVVNTTIIHEGDELTIKKTNKGDEYDLKIKDPFAQDNKIIGILCYLKYKDFSYIETINKDEINKIKSKATTQFVWNDWFGEMAKKAIIKRVCKNHFSEEVQDLEEYDNAQYTNITPNENPIEDEATEDFKKLLEMKQVENPEKKLEEFKISDFDKRLEMRNELIVL